VIPTAILRVLDDFPLPVGISREHAAQVLANYWPTIGEELARQLIEQNPDRDADFTAGVDWAADTLREI
jgi:hypothetical protein